MIKSLSDYVREELSTPSNTTGMGNPMAPTDSTPGTEPFPPVKKKKKCKKCTSESLLDDEDVVLDKAGKVIKSSKTLFKRFNVKDIKITPGFKKIYNKNPHLKELGDLAYKWVENTGNSYTLRGECDELYNIICSQEYDSNERRVAEHLNHILQPYFDEKLTVTVNDFNKLNMYVVEMWFRTSDQYRIILINKI